MKQKHLLFGLIAIVFCLYGCVNEDDFDINRLQSTSIHPAFEANLVSFSFTARDFLDQIEDEDSGIELRDTLLNYDGHNGEIPGLYLRFVLDTCLKGSDLEKEYFNKGITIDRQDFDLPSFTIPELDGLPDMQIECPYRLLIDAPLDIPIPEFAKFDEDEEPRFLDSVVLSEGKLVFITSSDLTNDIVITLKSDYVINRQTGGKLNKEIVIPQGNNIRNEIDLSGLRLELVNAGEGDGKSKLPLTYSVTVGNEGETLMPGTDVNLGLAFMGENLTISQAYGKIGNPVIAVNDTLKIEYFSDSIIKHNTVILDDDGVDMRFWINNYTGIEIGFDLSDLRTHKSGENIDKYLFPNRNMKVILDDAPDIFHPKQSYHNLKPNVNSITQLPDEFIYDMKFLFGDGLSNSFIRPWDIYLDMHSVIDIPIKVGVNNFVSEQETDALDFIKDDETVSDYIDSVMLKLYFTNTFPADLNLELYAETEGKPNAPLLNTPVKVNAAKVDNM